MSLLSELSQAASDLNNTIASRIVAIEGSSGRSSSGFVWRTGLVVTAEESLDGEDDVHVHFADGASRIGKLVGKDPSTDVALIAVETPAHDKWPAAGPALPASLALVAGRTRETAIASLSSVTEVGPAWRSVRGGEIGARIVVSIRLTPRTHGAAVVAPDGSLVGMAVSSPRRQSLVIPTATLARSVAVLNEKGYVPRGWLGAMLQAVGEGVILLRVEKGSPAQAGGLLVGDVITTWNGTPVRSVGELSQRLGTGAVNTTAELGVLRGGISQQMRVTLGERPRA